MKISKSLAPFNRQLPLGYFKIKIHDDLDLLTQFFFAPVCSVAYWWFAAKIDRHMPHIIVCLYAISYAHQVCIQKSRFLNTENCCSSRFLVCGWFQSQLETLIRRTLHPQRWFNSHFSDFYNRKLFNLQGFAPRTVNLNLQFSCWKAFDFRQLIRLGLKLCTCKTAWQKTH